MRNSNYKPIGVPINLHLEFDQMTVGELSSILREWQALLRSAWREWYEIQYSGKAPTARLLAVSASTENSLDLLSDLAIPTLYFTTQVLGPAKDWPAVVGSAYHYLHSVWSQKERRYEDGDFRHVYIRGGFTLELLVDRASLKDSETGERIEKLWKIANSGFIDMTVEEQDDQVE